MTTWVVAAAPQAVPALTAHVIDTTGTLHASQTQKLETELTAFEQTHGSQVVVLMVPSTQPEDIASYANRVATTWKIGRKGVGDGLLLIVAKDDHRVRIEVARALEGAIPDLLAARVIDQAITPRFKQGDYAGGVSAGVTQILAFIAGEALPLPATGDAKEAEFEWMNLAIFMFIAVPMVGGVARSALGSRFGSLATAGIAGSIAMLVTASAVMAILAAMAAFILSLFSGTPRLGGGGGSSSWGSGRFGSGSSGGFGSNGGGFSSGGGGSFGGGGASGSW